LNTLNWLRIETAFKSIIEEAMRRRAKGGKNSRTPWTPASDGFLFGMARYVAMPRSQRPASHGPTTDVICSEEISATFCNVVGSLSNGGFGSTNGSQGTVGSATVLTPIPPCGNFWPAAEQCD
jgi:hypothetical protein